jgi:protein SCO1
MPSAGDGHVDPRDARYALIALAAIAVVTCGWWALALWPAAGDPEWLTRARAACFNAGPDGLPDVSGWMLLVGQPVSMVGFLALVWPRELAGGVRLAVGRRSGRAAMAGTALCLVAGLVAAGARVSTAVAARTPPEVLPAVMSADEHPRLDRDAPRLGLVDQRGAQVTLDTLRGRPALVTFAFANCHDICPVIVAQARAVRDAVWPGGEASLVIVTLDPWRDTPDRLPVLASRWGLEGPRDHLLGGTIDDVEAVLDAWHVARTRDGATGQVSHPPLTYLLDATGRIAFVTLSGHDVLRELAERVTAPPASGGTTSS